LNHNVINADCRTALAEMQPDSADAIVTDPPYGLRFMGKQWDHGVPGIEFWQAAIRVLKPGAHLLAFGGTRTHHRLTCAIEDAGFEIRDCLMWLYGTGFPKSHDISKAIDKAAGAEREVVGRRTDRAATPKQDIRGGSFAAGQGINSGIDCSAITAPATEAACQWDGWGTALKPAWEPIILARKPFPGTVADNVLNHNTGALNIDACRVGTATGGWSGRPSNGFGGLNCDHSGEARPVAGRWPANVVLTHHPECECLGTRKVKGGSPTRDKTGEKHGFKGARHSVRDDVWVNTVQNPDGTETVEAWNCHPDCPVRILDEQSGERPTGEKHRDRQFAGWCKTGDLEPTAKGWAGGDTGGASRFFYCAKASRAERNAGLEGREAKQIDEGRKPDNPGGNNPRNRGARKDQNNHPTVKPVALMRYLCRLVTPPGGLIIDPFCGSGSTGIAAVLEGFSFIGIDSDPEATDIARLRIAHAFGALFAQDESKSTAHSGTR